MITLSGLTEKQVELLEVIWSIESMAEVEEWMNTLSESDRQLTESLIELLDLELLDAQIKLSAKFPQASKIIKRIKAL